MGNSILNLHMSRHERSVCHLRYLHVNIQYLYRLQTYFITVRVGKFSLQNMKVFLKQSNKDKGIGN